MKVDIKNLKAIFLVRYLCLKGWSGVTHPNPAILYIMESPHDEVMGYYSVALPKNDEYGDFSVRVQDALVQIASFEQRSVERVLSSVLHWDVDIFKAHISERRVEIDSIPLILASGFIDSLSSLVGLAAYSEFEPKKFFPMVDSASSEFTYHCRYEDTYRGIFGLTVECPLQGQIEQLAIDTTFSEKPFARKVMERLASGYLALDEAIQADDPEILIEGYISGFNANMFEVLTDSYEKLDQLSVDFGFDWATELPTDPRLNRGLFRFDGRAYEFSKYAARELNKEEVYEASVVVSHIYSLRSDLSLIGEQQEPFEHAMTLNWERERNVFVKIQVSLPLYEYRKACYAHKNGRKIQVSGVPEKRGEFWILTQPTEVTF
jgi:hypothetical protein